MGLNAGLLPGAWICYTMFNDIVVSFRMRFVAFSVCPLRAGNRYTRINWSDGFAGVLVCSRKFLF
jgi:hypothetical protein